MSGAARRLEARLREVAADAQRRLAAVAGGAAVCEPRDLTAAERGEIADTLPGDTPVGADGLAALDVRFRRPSGAAGYGSLVVPRWFSQTAIDSAGGVTSAYPEALATAADRRDLVEELRAYFVHAAAGPGEAAEREFVGIERMAPLHVFAEFALQVGVSVDEASMRHDNAVGFGVRRIRDTTRFSRHAVGAIDLAPLTNPQVVVLRARAEGTRPAPEEVRPADLAEGVASVAPATAGAGTYGCHRGAVRRADVLTSECATVAWFRAHGWTWGGDWRTLKDFQHFSPGLE